MARRFKPLYSLAFHKGMYLFREQRLRIWIERADYNELLDIAEEMMQRKPGGLYKSKHIDPGCDASERSTTIAQERETGF